MKPQLIAKMACSLAVLCMAAVTTAKAEQQLSIKFKMPVHLECTVDAADCDNSPGPYITLNGDIALGGLQAQIILQNNVKGTHTAEVTVENVGLIPLGEGLVLPKQPVLGGVGGNPWIYLKFWDKDGDIGDEILLGRCVQGLKITGDFLNDVLANTDIDVGGCMNHPGPWITIGGDAFLSGLKAKLIFRNNVKGTHTAERCVDFDLIPEGTCIKIPKQPVLGGAGGNPLISVVFLHGDGSAIDGQEPIMLGRCNKL